MKIIQLSIQTSLWAKNHVRLSRILIVLGFVLLTATGIFTGQLLYMHKIRVPINVFWFAFFVYVFSLSFYPSQKISLKHADGLAQYLKRKVCDLLLAGTTFVMILQQGNIFSWDVDRSIMTETLQRARAAYPVRIDAPEGTWKAQKREWKDRLKSFLSATNRFSKGEKTMLTVLAVVLGIAILIGIAMLACNLSCSGAEGAAGAVAIFGVAGVVLLFVLFMKYLNKKENL